MASRTFTKVPIMLGFIALLSFSSPLNAGLAEDVAKENALQSLLKAVKTADANDLQVLTLDQIKGLTLNRDRLFTLKDASPAQTSRIIQSFQRATSQDIDGVARCISLIEYDHFSTHMTPLNRTALIEALARKTSRERDLFPDGFAGPVASLLKDTPSPFFLECLLVTGAESAQPPSLLAEIVSEFNKHSPLATLIDIKVGDPQLKNFFRELFKMSPAHMQPFCKFSFMRECSPPAPSEETGKKPPLPQATASTRSLPQTTSSRAAPNLHYPFLGLKIFQYPALMKTLGRMQPSEIQDFSEVLKTLGPQMFGTDLAIESMLSIIDAIGSSRKPTEIREFVSTFHRPEMHLFTTRLHNMPPQERALLLTRLAFLTPPQLLECAEGLSALSNKVSKDVSPHSDLTFVWWITLNPTKIKETVDDFVAMIPPKATADLKKFRDHLAKKVKAYRKSHPQDAGAIESASFSSWAKGSGFNDLFDEIDEGFDGDVPDAEDIDAQGIDDDGIDDYFESDVGDDQGGDTGGGDLGGGLGDLDFNTFTQLFGTDSSMPSRQNSFPFPVFLA